jgi:L-ascorbate metabolism protein UlaG (beta-lactamase superfamily)
MATLTFLGHSAVRVEGSGTSILIDPFLSGNPAAKVAADRISCDYVIVTHAHGDHLGDTLAIATRTGATVISSFEIATWAERHGLSAHGMNVGGAHDFPFGRVRMTIAHHTSSFPDGSYGGTPAGVVLTIDGKKIHHAGDTALTHDMSFAGDEGLDLALLPIGDNFTMGVEDALRALDFLRPKAVVPIHYGTWPIIAADVTRFAAGAVAKGVTCHVLASGESLHL